MIFREEEEEAIRQEQENQEYESEDENGSENKGPWAPLSSSPPKTFSSVKKPKANGSVLNLNFLFSSLFRFHP